MIVAVTNIRASRVNLIMNDYAAGLPSPLSFLGLGAAIAPELGVDRWSVGVLPVLHQVSVSDGRTKPEMEAAGGRFSPTETVEDMTGFVEVSLLFDFPKEVLETDVLDALEGKRIAGGIVDARHFKESVKANNFTASGSNLRSLPRGYVFMRPRDASKTLTAVNQASDFSRIADTLYPAEKDKGSGWLVPAAVGHRLIEDPETSPKRIGVRDPTIPHVFTEPVLGVAELVSSRKPELLELDTTKFLDLFWRWDATGEWIVGHPSYNQARVAA